MRYFKLHLILGLLWLNKGIEIDKDLGIIAKVCNDYSILTAGQQTITMELDIAIPRIQNHGNCVLLDKAATDGTLQKSLAHYNETGHESHQAEKFAAASAMSFLMEDTNDYLRRQIISELEIEENLIFPVELGLSHFDNNPKICMEEDVHCSFHIGFNIATECVDSRDNPMKPGFALHTMRIPVRSEENLGHKWHHHCGILLETVGDGDDTTNVIGPGLCCSLNKESNRGHCPVQAGTLLSEYNRRAVISGAPTLAEDKAYCLSLSKIHKKSETPRRRRSEFWRYWGSGGPLNPDYILSKIHNEESWTSANLRKIEKQVLSLNDNIIRIGQGVSKSVDALESKLCRAELNEWADIAREQAYEIAGHLKQEIRDIVQDCSKNQIPLMADREKLTNLCTAIAGTNEQCQYVDSLSSCRPLDVFVQGSSILILFDVTMRLPSSEPNLECRELEFFSVPANGLTVLNVPIRPQKEQEIIPQSTETPELQQSKELVKLFQQLLSAKNQTRTKRDLKSSLVYHYFKIDLPTIKIFYLDDKQSQKVAFTSCTIKRGIAICELGGDGEYYNHSSCLEGLIGKRSDMILGTCPAFIRSGSKCEYHKLDNGVVVSGHEDIEVQRIGPGKRKTFATPGTSKCKGQNVCILRQETYPQAVYCNNVRYLIDSSKAEKVTQEIEEASLNISFADISFSGFHNENLNKINALNIPFSDKTIATGNSVTHILSFVLLAVAALSIIACAIKIARCVCDCVRLFECLTKCCTCPRDSEEEQSDGGTRPVDPRQTAIPLLEFRGT